MHDELTKEDIRKMREELNYRRLELMPELIEEVALPGNVPDHGRPPGK